MSLISWFKDLYFTYSLVTNVYMLNAWEAAVFSKCSCFRSLCRLIGEADGCVMRAYADFFVLLGLYFMVHYTVSFVQAFYIDMAEVNGGTA
jgi:hypothetical protein